MPQETNKKDTRAKIGAGPESAIKHLKSVLQSFQVFSYFKVWPPYGTKVFKSFPRK